MIMPRYAIIKSGFKPWERSVCHPKGAYASISSPGVYLRSISKYTDEDISPNSANVLGMPRIQISLAGYVRVDI